MSEPDVTTTDLVTGIYNGDRNAESLLIQKYSRQVLYILEKRCGDRELARDICQETFMVLLEKFRNQMIDDPSRLAAYIQQTAVNILIASKRKEARRQTFPDSELIDT
jgi:RNA polymerase sigma-70 factor (ECF subfamily)